ncbi:ABC transporter permease [Geomesophilobacter sediminis]|uniref:Transport permease protein n=1 Tax=Geomesophilobacter sediminis TaxID=2798584 RepID=A0A8J7M1S5_9BACT|nr:ABC transporter permease [Geomesophilobacter sediminis]MBJ6727085.1 ABC transporter permease [Geomesophilobacter sediminis]
MHRIAEPNSNRIPTLIQPQKRLFGLGLKSLWQYRELLYFLVWRDVLVRYKQTAVGASWAILQPVLTMLIFTVIFGKLAKIPSDGKPYPVFAFAALLPWNFFSQALLRSGSSLVGNANLITKVYFPRLLIPLAASTAPLVDLFFSFLVLIGLMLWYHVIPTWGMLFLPLFVAQSFLSALAVGLWLTTLNVKYRDVGYVIPFLIQAWMYASPVAYPATLVPEKWRLLYSLNPMVGAIEGFRWAIMGSQRPDFAALGISLGVVSLTLVGGVVFFKYTERTFADII